MTMPEAVLEFDPSRDFPIDTSPQVARVKVAHYVGNYLALAEIVVAVVYDLLQERRAFTIDSGDRVRDAFDIAEADILTRWAAIDPAFIDDMTEANAHDPQLSQPLWGTLFDFMVAETGDPALARSMLHWVRNAMSDALDHAEFPILFQFQLNILDQWLTMHELGVAPLAFDQLLVMLGAIAAIRETITAALDFSFEDLRFTQPIAGGVSLRVDGVIRLAIPDDPADFLTWDLDGDTFSIALHFDEIAMTGDSEFLLLVDNPFKELRFPFGGSLNDLRFLGVTVSIIIDPEHSTAHTEAVGPYHRYQDFYFVEREGESLGRLSIRVDNTDFDLASTLLTTLLSAGGAYLDLVSSFDFDDLAELLEDAAESGIEALEDFSGLAGTITGALQAFVPDALACSTQDYHKPFRADHVAVEYNRLRARAEGDAVLILNDPPAAPEPDGGGIIHHLPTDPEIIWPGILDELGPGPEPGGNGGGRGLSALGGVAFDAIRIPPTHRAEYERRLAGRRDLAPLEDAAARLLIEGFDVRAVRLLNRRQVNAAAKTVAGRAVAPATLAAVERLSRTAGQGAFLFAPGGRLMTGHQLFAAGFGPLTEKPPAARFEIVRPSHYAPDSPLHARHGSALDPAWIGLSVNSFVVDTALRLLAGSGAFDVAGEVEHKGLTFAYAASAADTLRLQAELDAGDRIPRLALSRLTVTLSRLGHEVSYEVNSVAPLVPLRLPSGCLPDDALLSVVRNAGCVERLTGGAIPDAAYRDELLYRHFIHVEARSAAATVNEVALRSGDPGRLAKESFEPRAVLALVLRDVWAWAGRAPVLFDPYYRLSPTIQSYDGREGWLNIYERY